MAKFLITIWTEEVPEGTVPPEELQQQAAAYQQVTDDMRSSEAFVAGEGINPSATAKTVRVQDGRTETTDGPFAETKEQLGGFYLLDVKDEDEAVQPTATATTVRAEGGKPVTTDGPFAETKEQLGGFYLLDCKDLDEAIEWAAKVPVPDDEPVEIRPVMDYAGTSYEDVERPVEARQ